MDFPAGDKWPVVVLASSFYTACLEQPFTHALAKHGVQRRVVCVPYNQLQALLLHPRSMIPADTPATVILLLRVEDLIRLELAELKHGGMARDVCLRVFRERTTEFLDVLGRVSGVALTLLLCPSGRGAHDVSFLGTAVRIAEHRSAAELLVRRRHRVVAWSDFEGTAPARGLLNVAGDRLGHVPFSPEGLDQLAEFFVQRLGTLPVTTLAAQSTGSDQQALQRFLGGLRVEVGIAPFAPEDEEATLGLVRHTTHFINIPDRQWSAGGIRGLLAPAGGEAWIVRVRDRFGDYGISGAVTFTVASGIMRVGLCFLTCPVLGKQVEHALLLWLADAARQRQATPIDVPFGRGRDNQALYTLLAQLEGAALEDAVAIPPLRTERTFSLPVSTLEERVADGAPCPAAVAAMLAGEHRDVDGAVRTRV